MAPIAPKTIPPSFSVAPAVAPAAPAATPVAPSSVAPAAVPVATPAATPVLPSFSTAPPAGVASPAPTVLAQAKDESHLLSTILRDEIAEFCQELAEFKTRSSLPLKGVIGSSGEADKQRISKLTSELSSFVQDLNETTKTQDTEVRTLRTELLEVSELLEEARVRYSRRKNAGYNHLLKMRPLDPANRRKMSTIEQLHVHIEQQMEEASRKLETVNRQRTTHRHNKPIEIPINEVPLTSILSHSFRILYP